jgi:hypothetical protein
MLGRLIFIHLRRSDAHMLGFGVVSVYADGERLALAEQWISAYLTHETTQ